MLSAPGVRWVVLMEGINDIGHSTSAGLPEQDVTADQIIAGMKQIVARVHEHGAKIYGATLTPYEGTVFHGYYQPEGEAKREAVNAWIRSPGSISTRSSTSTRPFAIPRTRPASAPTSMWTTICIRTTPAIARWGMRST